MKNIIAIAIFVLAYIHGNAQLKTVVLQFTQTADYCGGAAPSEEMLTELNTPKPYVKNIFYIIKGTKHSLKYYKKIVTNDSGIISIRLPRGTYAIFTDAQMKKFEEKKNTDSYIWDNKCLLYIHKKPLLIFNTASKKNTSVNIHQKCFYSQDCGKFIGQMPA